jgi:hypothetical protein
MAPVSRGTGGERPLGADVLPVAFIDDSRGLQGSSINGIGLRSERSAGMIADDGVNIVLSRCRRCRASAASTRSAARRARADRAGHQDIVGGRATVGDIREVDTSILGRDPYRRRKAVRHLCARQGDHGRRRGRLHRVGLCRQIVRLNPSHFVLFEMSGWRSTTSTASSGHWSRMNS